MKRHYFYKVEFDVKKYGSHYEFYCMACNMKEARTLASAYWINSHHFTPMSHIIVSRVSDYKPYTLFTFYRVAEY